MPTITHEGLSTVLQAEKEAVTMADWRPSHSQNYLEIRSPLKALGIVLQGLDVFMTCRPNRPDEQITVGLTIQTPIGPKCFARVDWRASAGHGNTHAMCGGFRHFDAGRTHFHNPELHQHIENPIDFIAQNLPIAVSIEPPPNNFSELLARCAILLNVTNLTETQVPPWQTPSMF